MTHFGSDNAFFSEVHTLGLKKEYLKVLRKEVYTLSPFAPLIETIVEEKGKDAMYNDEFYFVNNMYNWKVIRHILVQLTGLKEDTEMSRLLVKTWNMLPKYLKQYKTIYRKCTPIIFLHNIVVRGCYTPKVKYIKKAAHLPSGCYYNLGCGIVVKNKKEEEKAFLSIITSSSSTLRLIASVLAPLYTEDVSSILSSIRDNKGTRYYNISTMKFINKKTLEKFILIDDSHFFVACDDDIELFQFIGELLSSKIKLFEAHDHADYSDCSDSDSSYDMSSSEDEESDSYSGMEAEILPVRAPPKRKAIPKKIRDLTWRTYIGGSMDGKCWCCDDKITIETWHAGHVLAYCNGGPNTVANLRPVCPACNLSMRSTHMKEYIKEHNLNGRGATEL